MKTKSSTGSGGFTLVEILVSVMLLGLVLTSAYAAFQTIIVQQGQIDAQVDINRDVYYYTEKFFDLIQGSGNIDYEEYWNRRVLGYQQSWVGPAYTYTQVSNYGNGGSSNIISCMSSDCTGEANPTICISRSENYPADNCYSDGAFNSDSSTISGQQIYGQYSELFFDRNRNANDDGGDEDGDGSIRGDQDDRDTGQGPAILGPDAQGTATDPVSDGMPELYLYKELSSGAQRTFFRYILRTDQEYIDDDPRNNGITVCNTVTREGCLGMIQMLKLDGTDTDSDGRVDTWSKNADFDSAQGWIDLFPPYIDVVDTRFFISPTKNPLYAWNNPDVPQDNEINVQASVRIRLAVELAYARQKRANRNKDVFQTRNSFTTMINLGTLGRIENN